MFETHTFHMEKTGHMALHVMSINVEKQKERKKRNNRSFYETFAMYLYITM